MMKIRAVTAFFNNKFLAEEHCNDLLEKMEKAMKVKAPRPVWTWRISFPPLPKECDPIKIAEIGSRIAEDLDVLVAPLHLDSSDARLPKLAEAMGYPEVFSSIRVKSIEGVVRAANVIYDVFSLHGEEALTRLAVIFGEWPLTPYFPASVNTRGKIGVGGALLYPNEIDDVLWKNSLNNLSNIVKEIEEYLVKVSDAINADYYGIDLSISPWMEESVAKIIEKMCGEKLPNPGSMYAIFTLNNIINMLARKSNIKITGFNEVMLPLGEDDVLKERGLEGKIKLNHLISYSSICVAGLDMAAVSINEVDLRKLVNILQDVYAISMLRGKNIGVRIILSSANVGDKVFFERFGWIPVIACA